MNTFRKPAVLMLALCLLAAPVFAEDADDVQALLRSAPPASAYPNASVINLIDEAKYVIHADGSWSNTTRVTAKICNERGRNIANVQMGYNAAFEDVRILRARTIRKDGTVVEVKPEEIREVSPYSGYAMYSSVKAKIMIMPAIEDDCIVDYEWVVNGRDSIMRSSFGTAWYFQSQEPTLLSRFTLEAPADRNVDQLVHNTGITPTVTTSKDGKTKTYVWEGRNYGEIEPEPFMPPLSEICPWFEISSVKSWGDIASWYWKLVEPQMKATPDIEKTVADLTKDRKTDAEKAKALFYWVQDKIRYVGLEFGASAYEPHGAKDVFVNRYGDCKDQATLLVAMLRLAGVKAYPVLVSTTLEGKTSSRLPSPHIFDHCIAVAVIDGKRVWFDTTAEVCAYGDIPQSDRGREVLVIEDGKGVFAETPDYSTDNNGLNQTAVISMKPDGAISASASWYSLGSLDMATRMTYRYAKPNQIKESIIAAVSLVCPDAQLREYTVTDPLDRDNPIKAQCEFEATGWANRAGKLLIFKPTLYQQEFSQTPFSKPTRTYPMRFTEVSGTRMETTINLPGGFRVEELPETTNLESEYATFKRTFKLDGSVLKITEELLRRKARLPVEKYQQVKKFYEDVIQAQKQQVVLRET